MSNSSWCPGPEGDFSPEALAGAVRGRGTEGLTDLFTAMAGVLQALAADRGELFATDARARGAFTVLLEALQSTRGAVDALEARTLVALRDVTRRERLAAARDRAARGEGRAPAVGAVHEDADRVTRRDLSLITRRSPHRAGRTLGSAQRLVESMPSMMSALGEGKLGADAVYAAADAGAVLSPETLSAVDEQLGRRLADLDSAGTRQVKDAVAVIAAETDPEGERERHRRSVPRRHVTLTPGRHGMATLSAHLPAMEAELIRKKLALAAERARSEGSREGHGAQMADELVARLLSRDAEAEPVTLELGVVITDRALFRPEAGEVAQLEGYGPVPAVSVRAQIRAALETPQGEDPFGADGPAVRVMIRRLYTHPTTGELVAMDARSRVFPPGMKRFLSRRDLRCRGPFCNAHARQADHIVPHARGGPTSLANGQQVCAHCNQKEDDTAAVLRERALGRPGHSVTWTGHSGARRTTVPPPLIWPRGRDRSRSRGREHGPDPDGVP
ncbi:DUF222 domain-containing protein [Brachybacterium sp. YJGR34]|uniref:HNH endonuclease n=1 Tax=Brachybacterium sp. YJGR34 TaxID=2059911 RepID=UPI0018E64E6E|nr:DUF222 domain-containing protein [Brachybacterium sp. YJGR34]